jgi:ATP adenylyltransferase
MDYLWTPWRFQYISKAGEADECIFCTAAADSSDEEGLIVYRGVHAFIILNRFPYTSGHVMVVPYAHVPTLEAVPDEAAIEIIRLAQQAERVLRAVYRPDGLNMGINLGKCAGAGVTGHVHLHVLPRWGGDANFMTTVGETRVIPEDMPSSWKKLRDAFQNASA